MTTTLEPSIRSDGDQVGSDLRTACDRFLDLAARQAATRPWLVVMTMHEFARHLYPADPYLPFDATRAPPDRIAEVLRACTAILESAGPAGYFEAAVTSVANTVRRLERDNGRRSTEGPTQQVYGALWDELDTAAYLTESTKLLDERLPGCNLQDLVVGQRVLDLGCGSGRHTIAMAQAGAAEAHGVDLGAASLNRARQIAADAAITNVHFHEGSAHNLPFEDESFDFVLSNGVLHHTGDTLRGLREFHRVSKPGCRGFLYLYGDGGLFWYARKHMPKVMKQIPQAYTMAVLDLIGMPSNRFVFTDNWYVPIEHHITRVHLEQWLSDLSFQSFEKMVGQRETDLDRAVADGGADAAIIWGDGEHRYLLTK